MVNWRTCTNTSSVRPTIATPESLLRLNVPIAVGRFCRSGRRFTQILIDTVETRGVVRVWTISLGNCLTASAYGHPVHLVRIPQAIYVRRFDDRTRSETL